MTPTEALTQAKRAGLRVSLDGDRLSIQSSASPPADIREALAEHKAAIIDLLQNPVCQQCGESDGLQTLVDWVWLHQECAANRRRRGIPWSATLDELAQMTVAEVTAVTANARLEIPKPRAKRRAA
jgi:TubC N-terminal docking domain